MSEPYLILHRVRGEPAFDIAIRLEDDSEGEFWIIPTSGHRAYPWAECKLSEIPQGGAKAWFESCLPIAADWPDHYAVNDRPLREDTYVVAERAKGLLEGLGLVKKVKVERRV